MGTINSKIDDNLAETFNTNHIRQSKVCAYPVNFFLGAPGVPQILFLDHKRKYARVNDKK
jgi:hypothetical protein